MYSSSPARHKIFGLFMGLSNFNGVCPPARINYFVKLLSGINTLSGCPIEIDCSECPMYKLIDF